VADPVVQAGRIERHGRGLAGEPAGEDPAVVGEDLLGDAVAAERLQERLAHGPRRRPQDELRDHAEPRPATCRAFVPPRSRELCVYFALSDVEAGRSERSYSLRARAWLRGR